VVASFERRSSKRRREALGWGFIGRLCAEKRKESGALGRDWLLPFVGDGGFLCRGCAIGGRRRKERTGGRRKEREEDGHAGG